MVDKSVKICSVRGCDKEAERTFPLKKVESAGLDLDEMSSRKALLCKEHYKEFKKLTKQERVLESIGR